MRDKLTADLSRRVFVITCTKKFRQKVLRSRCNNQCAAAAAICYQTSSEAQELSRIEQHRTDNVIHFS